MQKAVGAGRRSRARNLSTSLNGRRRSNPMKEFDALPPELRGWLRQASLPWSARSARKIWAKGLREGGIPAALSRLGAAEAATLSKDSTVAS